MTKCKKELLKELDQTESIDSKKEILKKLNRYINPGSDEAIDLGCVCPISDNNYGNGGYLTGKRDDIFTVVKNCNIHGW